MATPIFHALFGTKWDPSIFLFQLLLIRGIFTIFIGYYNNVLLALAHVKTIMWMEILRDSIAVIAIIITLPYMALTKPGDPVWGISILLYGQLLASAVTWLVTLIVMARLTGRSLRRYIADMLPYLMPSVVIMTLMKFAGEITANPWIEISVETSLGLGLYLGFGYLARSVVQREVIAFLLGKFKTPQKDEH